MIRIKIESTLNRKQKKSRDDRLFFVRIDAICLQSPFSRIYKKIL